MAYLGAVAVISAVYMIWREYSSMLTGELEWCRRFLKALTDYRDKIRCYMDTPSRWAAEYSDCKLRDCGFLTYLGECGDFRRAYSRANVSMKVSADADATLKTCFDRLGEGYLETELETLGTAIEQLKRIEEGLSVSYSKRRKAVGALLGAFASGVVILVM